MLSRRLMRKGYEVSLAVDGQEAVSMAKEEKPDLILLDISLPVMDGFEAARRIRSAPESRSIPILGLSSFAMVGDRNKALEAGFDDYDTKPVELSRLLEKMKKLL